MVACKTAPEKFCAEHQATWGPVFGKDQVTTRPETLNSLFATT